MNKIVFVLGPESSGTKLVARCFLCTECEGCADWNQPFDSGIPKDRPAIMFRRSFPHGRRWFEIPKLVQTARELGYSPMAVVCQRDMKSMIMSALNIQHVFSKEQEIIHIRRAYQVIFSGLWNEQIPFWTISYESLTSKPKQVLDWLFAEMGLTWKKPLDFPIENRDEKYYG